MPTCRIALYDHAMVIAVTAAVLVKYADIENVKCERSWWSSRLNVSMCHPKIVFSLNLGSPEKLAGNLKRQGRENH